MSIFLIFIFLIHVQGAPVTNEQIGNEGCNFVEGEIMKYKFFENPTIPFQFEDSTNDRAKQRVNEAIKYLEQFTCLKFEETTSASVSKNYLLFVTRNNSAQGECWGYPLPEHTSGVESPWIGVGEGENCDKGIITYLILRALGFVEEHRRLDRDEYVEFICDNIQNYEDTAFKNLFIKQENSYPNATNYIFPYDYNSITHLAADQYAKVPGQPTIKARGNRNVTFQPQKNRTLSVIDVVKINAAYNCFNEKPEYYSTSRMSVELKKLTDALGNS